MEEIFLEAEPREEIGRAKVKALKEKGFIPAIVYGDKKDAQALKVSRGEFIKLQHQHRLENIIINLKVKEEKKHKVRACLIKELQYDPVGGEIIHIDFNEISLTKAVKIKIPVITKGEPAGVKVEGGSLEHLLWEIEVECLPTDIPKEIAVDVSNLKIGDSIHIKDMTFPPKVKILDNPETIVLSVTAPIKEEVAAAPAEGEAPQEPEVIKEKKEVPAEEDKEEEGKEKKEK